MAHALRAALAYQGPGKKWEHYELTKNKRVKRNPIHVKKGDTVQIIAGNDKGKIGEIKTVLLKIGKVVVDGVNVKVRNCDIGSSALLRSEITF